MFGCFGPDIVWAGAGMRNAQERAQSSLQIGSVQDLKNGEAQKHLDAYALRLFSFFLLYIKKGASPTRLISCTRHKAQNFSGSGLLYTEERRTSERENATRRKFSLQAMMGCPAALQRFSSRGAYL